MAFQDVDTSGQIVTTQNEQLGSGKSGQAGHRSVLDNDDEDSYEELSHSLPMEQISGVNEKPDRID